MSISIRLDKSLEESLRRRLQINGISMSDFIRDAICEKLSRHEPKLTPYELGEDLFGSSSSEVDDLSINRKAILREKLNAKHRR